MKSYFISALVLGIASFPIAYAESDLYVNGGVTSFDLDGAEPTAATFRGGWMWSENFGAELEGSFGLTSDDLGGSQLEYSIENQIGAYLVGRIPVTERASLFGRLGYTRTEIEIEYADSSWIQTEDNVAFGAGGELMFTDRFGIRGEYTRTEADDWIERFSLSGVIKFGGPKN